MRLPQIVATYRKLVQQGIKALASQQHIADARQAVRKLLVDGTIVLGPSEDGTAVCGTVHFKDWGEYVLEIAGWTRQRREPKAPVVAGAGFEPATFGL